MSALQYPICNYSGVVTDIRDREFYDPSSLPFPLSGPAPCKTICERFVYEVTLEVENSDVENTSSQSSNLPARVTPPKRPKSTHSNNLSNTLNVSKCLVYVYPNNNEEGGKGGSDIGMHDVVRIEGRLCEGEDTGGEDEWDGMDGVMRSMDIEKPDKPEKPGVSEIHCTKISVGRLPPPLTPSQVSHLKSGSMYDAFVGFLSGSSPTGMGRVRASVLAAWLMGWREGEGSDVGGVDLVIDGDREGFLKLARCFATNGIMEIEGGKDCHLSKRDGAIKGGPQMGEGGMVVIKGNMTPEVEEVVRSKRVRCLFQYGEGMMNADLRFVDFNPQSKRRSNRGNVYMKSPSDGWVGMSETLSGSVLNEFVDYVDYVRAHREVVIFGDAACKAIEDTFVSMRQRFAEGGPKVTEHDLETWMVILRGRVRGRGGGEVKVEDVEWTVNAWKEGRQNLE